MPTAASPVDSVEPSAVVVTVFVAGGARPATVSDPVSSIAGSAASRTCATRDTLLIVTATAGASATPPFAPARATAVEE